MTRRATRDRIDRPRRLSRLLVPIVALLLTSALAPPALAAPDPWPHDGQNALSFRFGAGPPASRAPALTRVWQKDLDADVTGTPVLDSAANLYVGTWAGTVYSLYGGTGRINWARFVGGPVPGSLLLANGKLYAVVSKQSSSQLVAMDKTTGVIEWTVTLDTQPGADAWASPNYSAANNLVYVGICACKAQQDRVNAPMRGAVVAVDATSGAVVWKTHTTGPTRSGGAVAGTPAVLDSANRVYVTTGNATNGTTQNEPGANAVLALNAATGVLEASFQATQADNSPHNEISPTKKVGFVAGPNVLQYGTVNPIFRVGAGAKNGVYYALSSDTLTRAFSTTVGVGSTAGGIVGSAAFDGRRIVGTSAVPTLFWSLNAVTGALNLATPGTDPLHYGPTSAGSGVGWTTDSDGFLDAFDVTNGRPLGRAPLGRPSTGGVALAFRFAFAAVGTTRGTGGGVAAFK